MVTVVPMAGHVGPVTGLVAELVSRGHQVRVYTGSRYRQRFTDLGATVVTWSAARDFDEDDLGATFPLARHRGPLTALTLVRDGFIGTAPGQVQDLRAELEREPADVLVADSMSFGGVLTGELLGLPWALLNVLPFNQSFESAAPPLQVRPAHGPLGRQRDRLLWLGYRVLTSPFNRAYNRARAKVGLPPRSTAVRERADLEMAGAGHRLSQPGRAAARPAGPGAFRRAAGPRRLGPSGRERSTRRLDRWSWSPKERTTCSPAELIEPTLLGLADLEVEVIATSGRRGRTEVGVTPPANARVVDLIDFASVLPRTAVFVTNAGWGGVLASLAAGVPIVAAAGAAADKPEIAARVARSGVGINLGKGRTKPKAVADAVREVLADPKYRGARPADRV